MKASSAKRPEASLRRVPAWQLISAVLLGLLAACADGGSGNDAPGHGVYVQAAWQLARTMPGHRSHVGKHKIACVKCHSLTDNAIGPPELERCAGCHEKEAHIEHAGAQARDRFGPTTRTDCTLCHQFSIREGDAGPGAVFAPNDCLRCHQGRQGTTPAVVVHGSSRCVSCHRPHEQQHPQPAACSGCHHDIHTTHAAEGKSETAVCTTCHTSQHGPAAEALGSCAACHAKQQPLVPATALFAGGHSACVACHRPHDFEKTKVVACRSCHENLAVLAAARVPAHAQCTSCHAPHAVRESPASTCQSCHAGVHVDHPEFHAGSACVGCHEPHPRTVAARVIAQPCSGCHQVARSDRDFHGAIACKDCHAPHAFKLALSDNGLCQRCHAREVTLATVVSAAGGHRNCQGCHRGLPHKPATLIASCETCHGGAREQVNDGHRACTNCHEPHSGQRKVACASCHKDEAATVPSGHQTCTNCHQPHSGATAGVECGRCHASEAQSAHGQIPGSCSNCHRPHGPKGVATPPACTSCHQASSLAGLHSVAKHQECRKCHAGHDDSALNTRAPCLACHADRKNHFPEAPRCISCHLFDPRR